MNTKTTSPTGLAISKRGWDYDAFLSYSTGADYRLAVRLEQFIEGFHQEKGIQECDLKPVKICMDGSDFRLSREGTDQATETDDKLAAIRAIIRPYLTRSAALLILWPGRDQATVFHDWELDEFLLQNRQNDWDRPVYMAVTRGWDHALPLDQYFSKRQVRERLHERIFFDLRGFQPDASKWTKVRDFEYERLRLAVELAAPMDSQGQPLSIGALYPGWQRAQEEEQRREAELQRKAQARKAATVRNLVSQSPITAMVLADALWQSVDTHESRNALAEVLMAYPTLHTHLTRPHHHIGTVSDLAFLGDDLLLSIDDGTRAINDDRKGALCIWDVPRRTPLHRDARLGGNRVLGISWDRVVVAVGSQLVAVRWYDDEDHFGFRSRWELNLGMTSPIEHLCYEKEHDLIAAAGGHQLAIVRDGDRAFIRGWEAPAKILAMAWVGPTTLALGIDEKLVTFDLEQGPIGEYEVGSRIKDCAPHLDGLAVLTWQAILLFRNGTASEPVSMFGHAIRSTGDRLVIAGGESGSNKPSIIVSSQVPDHVKSDAYP